MLPTPSRQVGGYLSRRYSIISSAVINNDGGTVTREIRRILGCILMSIDEPW